MFFDFHHHHRQNHYGIYNLGFREVPPENQWFSIGFHPKDIEKITEEDWEWLYQHSRDENCIAVGECGLDAFVEVDEVLQEHILERQIHWANEIQKPVIIHCVRRFSQILRFRKLAKIPLIIHGFNKKENVARDLLSHGFYLSFGRAVFRNPSLQEVVRDTPLDKIFLETDADDFRIEELYQKVSELRGISIGELKERVEKNRREVMIF